MAPNLVLTGFMGTGKSTVGRLVAAALGRELVDMDEWITAREGLSVAEIFARRGEDYFRERERELCRELSARNDLVIATGGGTLIDEGNRVLLAQATVVCLDASLDHILARLQAASDRPLLAGDGAAAAARLYAARRPLYARIQAHVDTDDLSPEQVASEILRRWRGAQAMIDLSLPTPDGLVPIRIGDNLLSQVGPYLLPELETTRCAIVTNPTVASLYGATVLSSLRDSGFEPVLLEIPEGEEHKTLGTVSLLYDRFVEARLDRRSLVIALGGGVVGDIAGLAAATFMRGLPFVQLPTTLLAMVDASIGGKVGVDHPAGKNLIGAYKFPRAILVDPLALRTLPEAEYRAGLAEVIKHGIIGDPELFETLDDQLLDAEGIARAVAVKLALVEQDPFEDQVRAHLNLGHTFGHALETLSGYQLRHGYAVAIGIGIAARLAAQIGCCTPATADRIVARIDALGLPTRVPAGVAAREIRRAMAADKKIHDGKLRLILPRAIGQVEIVQDVPEPEVLAALVESGASDGEAKERVG